MDNQEKAYHRVLQRQLRKMLGRNPSIPDEWHPFLQLVSDSYEHSDDDRAMLERSLELSSKELRDVNTDLIQQQQELEETLEALRSTQQELVASQELALLSLQLKEVNNQLLEQKISLENAYKELETAQIQLVQAEKMSSLGQLTAGVAHELNNPINFIYAGSQALHQLMVEAFEIFTSYQGLHKIEDPQKVIEALQRIESEKGELVEELQEDMKEMLKNVQIGAERSAEIVKGLKSFARTDNQESQFIKVQELLESTLVILGAQLTQIQVIKNYDYQFEIPCYPGQLNQVFMNIISNSVYAMKEKGEIEITISELDDNVLIAIKDSGEGISEEVISSIFNPFFTTKDVGEGTGLGLSIVYGIIERHQGKIWAESKKGKGACFYISLPKFSNQ